MQTRPAFQRSTALAAFALTALLAACSSTELNEKPATPAASTAAPGPTTSTPPASTVTTVDTKTVQTPAERIVYFDFDSYVVKEEFRPLLAAHAKALTASKGKAVIEGHADERGGSEYNLALGQKRSEAVARSLVLLGVADSQIESVSFGKERPADLGHDEAAWAKNRRAEIKSR